VVKWQQVKDRLCFPLLIFLSSDRARSLSLNPIADVVYGTTQLPFPDTHFDTATMLACLNHIPLSKRNRVLREARRVLKDEGQLVLTMINPVVGCFAHTIRHRYDPDQLERGMGEEEQNGLWKREVERLLAENGFRITQTVPFVFSLNRLYIAQKDAR
jgi:ubiquinone/menaquinone biosynthesis C-methylase UbiE